MGTVGAVNCHHGRDAAVRCQCEWLSAYYNSSFLELRLLSCIISYTSRFGLLCLLSCCSMITLLQLLLPDCVCFSSCFPISHPPYVMHKHTHMHHDMCTYTQLNEASPTWLSVVWAWWVKISPFSKTSMQFIHVCARCFVCGWRFVAQCKSCLWSPMSEILSWSQEET